LVDCRATAPRVAAQARRLAGISPDVAMAIAAMPRSAASKDDAHLMMSQFARPLTPSDSMRWPNMRGDRRLREFNAKRR